MLIAGEASGDILGAELVKALQEQAGHGRDDKNVSFGGLEFFGAGGPKMEAAGVKLAFDLTGHAVVGVWEALKNYSKFKNFFDRLLALARETKPDAIILIDYPGFNLRFAKAMKAQAREHPRSTWRPKVVYYVSPQIWAWHESRVHQIARDIDLVLTIFPFEKGWYADRAPDLHVEFVGHPLADRYAEFRPGQRLRPASPKPLVLMLPGSRERELTKHLPGMIEAAKQIAAKCRVRFRMILPNARLVKVAEPFTAALETLEIQTNGLAESLAEADLAIASSGTVTMECAYFRVPTIVLYKTSWSSYELGKRLIKVNYIAMPNLLAGEMIYPEFIQNAVTSRNISREALELLRDSARRDAIKLKLTKVVASLGGPGASARAAEAVLSALKE